MIHLAGALTLWKNIKLVKWEIIFEIGKYENVRNRIYITSRMYIDIGLCHVDTKIYSELNFRSK